jgi:class 3 adenylate cyclase/predicted ATPase
MDLGSWLRELGLGQYEATFRQNAIDETVLPSLTAEDLKDLGVDLVGHRRKLLDAIYALSANETPKPPASDSDMYVKDTAERRQVTVVFSDLVGSTALSARMDPEDLRELVSAYQKCVAETIRRFGGFVAKYMGDGVLAYFGYPQAHEDDAERAVWTGLELIVAVAGLETSTPLHARVGIATGMVVVGDLIGSGDAQERGIVGETPNLAARLQAIAEPNTVVIADSTRRLLGNLFELQDLGARDLKGMPAPVRAWVPLRASLVESRFEALHANGVTDLIGREEEFELLLGQWAKAKTGEGQVVLLSGEPGIGKSRLTAELLQQLASEPQTRLRYFCSAQHTDSALYPIIYQMDRAAGLARADSLQAKLDKLDRLLARSSTSAQDSALFAEMLSLANDGRYLAPDLAPQQRRQKTLDALVAQLEALAGQTPVLMIFEDAHWSDPTSLELLGQTVERIRALRVLLIVTFRPEFDPPWSGQPHVVTLILGKLGECDVGAIIDRLAGDRLISANIRREIIERTDGIPLFIEEMTKAVLETDSEGAAERVLAAVPSARPAIPASLHASLMARLDRLGPAKEVAQIGAALGREFSHALMTAMVRKPEGELNSALDRLVAAGLLFRRGASPDADYLFKHALVQDAAYGTLLRETRRALHGRIVETLENQFAEAAERQPELLARHCTEAGLAERAAALWGKAGRRSLERSALVEAAEQLRRALAQTAALPSTPALRREEINLQVALITPLIHVYGYAAPETKAAVDRAHQLIERAEGLGEALEDPLLLFSVLNGAWLASYVAGNGDAVCDLAYQFLELAEKQQATAPLTNAHRMVGTALLHIGELTQARAHLDRAIALYDPDAHRPLATRFGQDVRMGSLLRRSMTLWFLGHPEAALIDSENSLRDARATGHAATLFFALWGGNWTHRICGDYATASTFIDELASMAEEKGVPFWKAVAMVGSGCVCALTGKPGDAVSMITAGLTAYRSTGSRLWISDTLPYLAKAYLELGQKDDALRCTEEALAIVETTKEMWYLAEIQRTLGEVALASPKPDALKAEAHFERALASASRQQAKSLELRTAMSRARLWCDQGKVQQARELLAPVYGWFTEGFATRDLKEAKALLDELSS